MFTNEQAHPLFAAFSYNLMALVLTGALVLVGCDSNDNTGYENQIARIEISPDSVSLGVGEQADFSVVALTASGDTVRDVSLEWWSTDPSVFTVEDDGLATGQEPGSAFCNVEVNARRFVGRDSAFVSVF